jgi:TatD DNase family protein
MRTIIDTHAHLYELSDAPAVLRDCAAAGVSDVVALGVDLESNRKHCDLNQQLRQQTAGSRQQVPLPAASCQLSTMHIALGLHPGNIISPADTAACFAFMREHVKQAVAIGETGLDFWYKWVRKDEEKKREQREVFDQHLALAREFVLPIVIHSRGAWRECLEQTVRAGNTKAVFHWYSGPLDVLQDILAAGFFVSFTPALGYSPEHRKAAELAPLDRVLIETDTPVAYAQGQGADKVASTPKDVWRTLKLLGELRGVPEGDLLQTVNANARRFFNI